MNNKIDDFVKKNNLLSQNDTVLIAFSGGADSVFLAEYLIGMREKFNLKLKIAHIEHGIRGDESLCDCEFSRMYAKKHSIDFFELHIDAVNEAKKAKMGVEEYSRKKRYEFFDTVECDKIATAHNLTDNVETMLFRIARGTSLHGLCSIPVRRDKIIRPLLCVTAEEIRACLDKNNIEYCVDSTNDDNSYSRNYIRNIIIPELKNINSEFLNNASRLIENVNENDAAISEYIGGMYHLICQNNQLIINSLKEQPTASIKRIIVKYFNDNGVQLDSRHLNEVYSLLERQGKIQIKGAEFAVSDGRFLRYAEFSDADFDNFTMEKRILSVNSESDFLNYCKLCSEKFDFYCDYDKIIGNVYLRRRQAGDSITPVGRHCSKTLKKIYNEYHIPIEKRASTPVICDDNGIIGIYEYCADERVKIDFNTRNILNIVIHMDTEDKN